MAAKDESLFRENSHVTKLWKTTFRVTFFNKMWLEGGEHEYVYIAGIKYEKIILFKNGCQNKFCDIEQ